MECNEAKSEKKDPHLSTTICDMYPLPSEGNDPSIKNQNGGGAWRWRPCLIDEVDGRYH
jgi:hypothetical protein